MTRILTAIHNFTQSKSSQNFKKTRYTAKWPVFRIKVCIPLKTTLNSAILKSQNTTDFDSLWRLAGHAALVNPAPQY